MGILDFFRRGKAGRISAGRAALAVPASQAGRGGPRVRQPTGFLSWVELTGPSGEPVAATLRRALPADGMDLVEWPEGGYFDWVGLLAGKPSEGTFRAGVNYDKPLRILVVETVPGKGWSRSIVGAMAVCDAPEGDEGAIELAYLEKHPGVLLRGIGKACLAALLVQAREKGRRVFLDALLKSRSHEFYAHCGMIEVNGTPWPLVTVRMAYSNQAAADRFIAAARVQRLIP